MTYMESIKDAVEMLKKAAAIIAQNEVSGNLNYHESELFEDNGELLDHSVLISRLCDKLEHMPRRDVHDDIGQEGAD